MPAIAIVKNKRPFEIHSLNTPGTYSPDIAVPGDKRVFGARDLFSLWFSLGIGLMVLQTGAFQDHCWQFFSARWWAWPYWLRSG